MKMTEIVKIAVLSGSFIITPVAFSSSNQALSTGNKMMLAHYGHKHWKYNNSWKYNKYWKHNNSWKYHNYPGKKVWWDNGYHHGWHKGYKYNNWYYKGKYGPSYKHWKHYSPYPY
ncbi:hypothetical protein [Legionella gresilensis]|uniref:hypothetical protein n=1 Tax=Legionella gresilensis TaxID=91823 RepID=UPI0010414704|nr:hypothetical protein [Legionella gresilensis]